MITDEDDCSAANPIDLFNNQKEFDSEMGPLNSFRCFEFGIDYAPDYRPVMQKIVQRIELRLPK